jgi:filamentous hemagglutinin
VHRGRIADHGTDFANKAIAEADIPDALFTALRDGKIVDYQGTGTGRPIYKYDYKGKTQYTAIKVGDNGFTVGANPTSGP